uniref:Putative phytochrome kinase substrate-related family protein n=1 Tax=Davidia involucrata TaxID=16924 RepID=A0A5B7BLF3_DAVIN
MEGKSLIINGNSSAQQPLYSVMGTSLHYISFTQKNNLRDASFSSYLRPELEPPPKTASQEDTTSTVNDDAEISIFDAQKYFNETNHDQKENNNTSTVSSGGVLSPVVEPCDLSAVQQRQSSVSSSTDGYSRNYRARSFHATPTASSEASWNSQTGLLSNPPGAIEVTLRNVNDHHEKKVRGSSFAATKWFFGRKCPCSGKKSVQVQEKLSPRTPAPKWHNSNSVEKAVIQNSQRFSSENQFASSNIIAHDHHLRRALGPARSFSDGSTGGFSFPILNPSSQVKLVSTTHLEDPPRDSLEVFQPLDESILSKSVEVQQRIPGGGSRDRRGFGFPASPISRVTATDDDVASDASSDLFEIESFSTQTTSCPMYRRRDSLDEASSFNARRLAATGGGGAVGGLYCRRSLDDPMIAPTECYEPSEASIDWSVTTAEGFDRASVTNFSVTASEFEDVTITEKGGGGGGDGGRRRGNGLLSCRCEKAVSVGPQPVRCGPEGHQGGPPMPLISTTRHVSSRAGSSNKPPLGRSHSARLSLAFAT